MIEQFIDWVSGIGSWAYLAIFLVVSLESAAFLGFLMPGETLVFLGGFLVSRGVLDLKLLIPLVAVAAILGDSIGYELGRLLHKSWFLRHGRWLKLREEHWKRIEDFFHRHGGKTIFLARFSAFFRILIPFFSRDGAAALLPLSALQRPWRSSLGNRFGSPRLSGRRELACDRALDRPYRADRGHSHRWGDCRDSVY